MMFAAEVVIDGRGRDTEIMELVLALMCLMLVVFMGAIAAPAGHSFSNSLSSHKARRATPVT
jgi:altronate dehydratase